VKKALSLTSAICLLALLGSAASAATPPRTVRASVSSTGEQGNSDSWAPSISGSGRWVAFASEATNLVRHDTNGQYDAFVRDLRSNTTKLVSRSSSGQQGDGSSGQPVVSRNGRWVAFNSAADNLVANDHNNVDDIFVRDLRSGTTRLVSISSSGEQGNGYSDSPSISANGRWVIFASQADNLVPNDNNQEGFDVFVHDLWTGRTEMVDVNSAEEQADTYGYVYWRSAISADGRLVIFESDATNLDPGNAGGIFVRNLRTGTTRMVTPYGWFGSLSANGRRVAFGTGDDISVTDLRTGTTTKADVTRAGKDLAGSCCPSISPNGRWVGFQSLVPAGGDNVGNRVEAIFVHDMRTGRTTMVSLERSGEAPAYDSSTASLSNKSVAFESELEDLVPGGDDYPYANDIFVHRLFPRP
jgi:Tol biopolymer transport system component